MPRAPFSNSAPPGGGWGRGCTASGLHSVRCFCRRPPRALLEGEGCDRGKFQSGCRAVTGDVKRLAAVTGGWKCGWGWCWGMGMPFGGESGPESWGGGGYPPSPFKQFPAPPIGSVSQSCILCPPPPLRPLPAEHRLRCACSADAAICDAGPGGVTLCHGVERGRGGKRKRTNGTSRHIQHSPGTPTAGLRERGNDTSKSTGRSGQQNAATRRNMRREERVTVQGPVKEQQPDGMSHRGGGGGGRGQRKVYLKPASHF